MKNKYNYRNILLFSGVVFLMTVLITVFAWQKIPNDAQIPIHWNVKGEVDNYGSKTFGLLIGPGMVFILTLLLTFIPRMEPRIENLQQSQKAYKVVWVFILLLMAALHLMTTLFALGKPVDITMSMAFVIGALFIAIGNYMGKIRSNFMFGIRTPWTLTSDIAWNKTHRLGGWLFFIVGLLVFLSGFFRSGVLTFALLFAGLFISLISLFVYSYWVWKRDEESRSIS